MFKRLFQTWVLVIGFAVALATSGTMQAKGGCSLASVQGAYGFSGTGFVQGTGATVARVASFPTASVGIVTFDGAGSFSLENTQSNNGTISSGTNTGIYTVNPNCTGSATDAGGDSVNFMIVAGGSELQFINTTISFFPGSVVSGVAISTQAKGGCSLASVQGIYGFSGTGFFQGTGATAATVASLPGATVGILAVDGTGGFSLESTESVNGTIRSVTDTGNYTVNPNCTGSSTNARGGTVNFVIVAGGSKVLSISTNPGEVASFVAIRQ